MSIRPLLSGTPVSLGTATGKVKIITDPYHTSFKQGDILVTEMTNPRLLPLMRKASAIVTDIGGMLCHAAITAREFGIPCIVGTVKGTKVLKNNQSIIVDANEGKIYPTK